MLCSRTHPGPRERKRGKKKAQPHPPYTHTHTHTHEVYISEQCGNLLYVKSSSSDIEDPTPTPGLWTRLLLLLRQVCSVRDSSTADPSGTGSLSHQLSTSITLLCALPLLQPLEQVGVGACLISPQLVGAPPGWREEWRSQECPPTRSLHLCPLMGHSQPKLGACVGSAGSPACARPVCPFAGTCLHESPHPLPSGLLCRASHKQTAGPGNSAANHWARRLPRKGKREGALCMAH